MPPHPLHGKLPDHVEVERLRAAAATEITTEEVKPIQTDFHFFVKDNIEKFRKLAEDEVRSSMKDSNAALDPFLVNSNLNTRLMKAWEALSKDQRDAYMVQEEDDRRRFMEEDEIASRHCATLTARGKSSNSNNNNSSNNSNGNNSDTNSNKQEEDKGSKEEKQESESQVAVTPDRESAGPKEKPPSVDAEGDEKKTDDVGAKQAMDVDASKRPMPDSSEGGDAEEETQESPAKKNKVSSEDKAAS